MMMKDTELGLTPTTTSSSYTSLKQEDFSDDPLLPGPATTPTPRAQSWLARCKESFNNIVRPLAGSWHACCEVVSSACSCLSPPLVALWNATSFFVLPLLTTILVLVFMVLFAFCQNYQASHIWAYFHENHGDFADTAYGLLLLYCGFVVFCALVGTAISINEDPKKDWLYVKIISTFVSFLLAGEILGLLVMLLGTLIVVPVVLFVTALWNGLSRITGGGHVATAVAANATLANNTVSAAVETVTVAVLESQPTSWPQ